MSGSNIKIRVPVTASGGGVARDRDGNVLPVQRFVPLGRAAVGDTLLNPLTLEVHRIVAQQCDDDVVTISVGGGHRDVTVGELRGCVLKVVAE